MLALIAAASIVTAVDAERAFARDAQRHGQWTAFRKWADADAVMFAPQPVNAQDYLKDREDGAEPVVWWPTKSFVSCDGSTAVNYGSWIGDGGASIGYFTTVWTKGVGGWRWRLDHGDALKEIRLSAGKPVVRKASCSATPRPGTGDGPAPARGRHYSSDGSLAYQWTVATDGSRQFVAYLFNGTDYEIVLEQKVPPKQ